MYSKQLMQAAASYFGSQFDLESLIDREVERAVFGGASGELTEHLSRNKRTLQEEYELVQQRKSSLSRRMRDYVEYLHAKSQETKEKGESA